MSATSFFLAARVGSVTAAGGGVSSPLNNVLPLISGTLENGQVSAASKGTRSGTADIIKPSSQPSEII